MANSNRFSRGVRILGTILTLAMVLSRSVRADQKPHLSSLDDFGKCTDRWDADACLEALQAYVKAHPPQAFAAGKVVTMNLNHWAAIPFFDKALATKADPARCADQRLALAVISGLALPNEDKDNKIVAAASKILRTKCWAELQAPVTQALEESGASGYIVANVCPVLAEKKQTSKACEKKAAAPPPPPPTQWEALDPKKLEVENTVKVYRGDEGRRVSLVKVKGKDYYLIKFEGFRGPWNGKVLLHREDPAGTGYDYWTQAGGGHYVSVVARRGYGSDYTYEVYPQGDKGPFYVGYDERESKAASAKAILSELAK